MARAEDKTVLVVDDEPDVRNYLSMILEDAGFNVLTAKDGDVAMRIIRERKPDFISLDLVMPKKSGHRLLYELRKDRDLSRIPVLIVTAHARTELGKQDLEDIMENKVISGPGVYLEKPVKPHDYVRCVQRALGIEETVETEEKIGIKEELEQEMRKASPDSLKRALEVLRRKKSSTGKESAD
ncbi:MAG: response regulator [Candidatus Latescibacterota bacterium]|nr:MAG: response regulator [Candidatus Latescibacterota bacterium]